MSTRTHPGFAWPALAVFLALGISVAQAAERVRSLDDVRAIEDRMMATVEKVQPATVALQADNTGASGSGVVVSEDGLILTAAHVVENAENVRVVFPNGRAVAGKVLGANATKDAAMVRIEDDGPFPFVELGESDSFQPGDWVIALGHSAGYDPARTPPVRFGRVISMNPGNFMTTSTTLIGGDSGGPLFDLDGRVIAIHSSISESLQSNNHSRIDGFKQDWDRMLAGETWGRLTMNPMADPESPVIGIEFRPGQGPGVLVGRVVPGGPADLAGVRSGDRVTGVDGQTVRDTRALLIILGTRTPGEEVELTLRRQGTERTAHVTLARRGDLFAK